LLRVTITILIATIDIFFEASRPIGPCPR